MPYRRKRKLSIENDVHFEPEMKRKRYQTRSVTKAAAESQAKQAENEWDNNIKIDWKMADFVWIFLESGGFGDIFKVYEKDTLKPYAIKEIEAEYDSDTCQLNQLNELSIHRSLKHQNVIDLRGYFFVAGSHFLVLELAIYGSLAYQRSLQQECKFSEPSAVFYIKQVISGLSYLHSNGIIHRDIKETNILITENKIAKICDFGISVAVDDWTQRRYTESGTKNYIAPEILNKQPYNQSADIYSFGIMIYTMLVNCYPHCDFHGSHNATQLFMSHQAFSLISSMIAQDPTDRISLKNMLKHEWIVIDGHSMVSVSNDDSDTQSSKSTSVNNSSIDTMAYAIDEPVDRQVSLSCSDIEYDSIDWGSVEMNHAFPHIDSMPHAFGAVDNFSIVNNYLPKRARRKRTLWTKQEENALTKGYNYFQKHKYNGSSIWNAIKLHNKFGSVLQRRTANDLRAKWKRMQQKKPKIQTQKKPKVKQSRQMKKKKATKALAKSQRKQYNLRPRK